MDGLSIQSNANADSLRSSMDSIPLAIESSRDTHSMNVSTVSERLHGDIITSRNEIVEEIRRDRDQQAEMLKGLVLEILGQISEGNTVFQHLRPFFQILSLL